MGLFGSIGKIFGGAAKLVGKAAGVASMVAPIPGLGFAGKALQGLGGLGKQLRKVERFAGTMPGGVSTRAVPSPPFISTLNVMRDVASRRTGNIALPPSAARNGGGITDPRLLRIMRDEEGYVSYDERGRESVSRGGVLVKTGRRKRKRRRASSSRRATSRRRTTRKRGRRRLTRAQLRAGFGGKRRMRRR